MEDPKHQPGYIPQIGIPEKNTFQERNYTRAIYHRATAPGFFGVIILCFFMSFINVKCNGKLVASYTGIDIIRGVDKSSVTNEGAVSVGVRQSAYNRLQIAKENFEWKKHLKEDYEKYINDAPKTETDYEGMDEFNIPKTYEEITSNPKTTSRLAGIAFIIACIGCVFSFIKKKAGTLVQIIAGLAGFVPLLLMQRYVKITLPKTNSSTVFTNEYSAPIVTTEFAKGYWIAFFLFLAVAVLGFLKLRWEKKMKST